MQEQSFILQGKSFDYFDHPYNCTRVNERAVEVAVGLALAQQAGNPLVGAILEVGAVLPHYRPGWPCDGHTCIDLMEAYPGVIQADVLTWQPAGVFDLILCISTLDHLQNADEVYTALARMQGWLAPGGLMVVTLPYGQPQTVGGGEWLDRLLLDVLRFEATACWRMDKIDVYQHLWIDTDPYGHDGRAYNGLSRYANTVYLLLWGAVEKWWGNVT
jgi:hypothetical protein